MSPLSHLAEAGAFIFRPFSRAERIFQRGTVGGAGAIALLSFLLWNAALAYSRLPAAQREQLVPAKLLAGAALGGLLAWFTWGLMLHLGGRIVGGIGPFAETLIAAGYGFSVLIPAAAAAAGVAAAGVPPLAANLVLNAAFIWQLVVTAALLRLVHDLHPWRAAVAMVVALICAAALLRLQLLLSQFGAMTRHASPPTSR